MLTPRLMKPLAIVAALAVVSVGLSACGVKGALQPPPESKVGGEPVKNAESADPGSNSVVKPKPHEGFILDGLLR